MKTKKLKTLKDFEKPLVSYIYKPSEIVAYVDWKLNGPIPKLKEIPAEKKGILIAIGAGIVGWSLCKQTNKDFDVFNKEIGIDLALRKAEIASKLTHLQKESFYADVPQSIWEEFELMMERSYKYYKIPE